MLSNYKLLFFICLSMVCTYHGNNASIVDMMQLKVKRQIAGDAFQFNGICMFCYKRNATGVASTCDQSMCCYQCFCDFGDAFVVNENPDQVGGSCTSNPPLTSKKLAPGCDIFLGYSDKPDGIFPSPKMRQGEIGPLIESYPIRQAISTKCVALSARVHNGYNWELPLAGTSIKDFEIKPQGSSTQLVFNGNANRYNGMMVKVNILCPNQDERCVMFSALGEHTYDLSPSLTTTTKQPTTTPTTEAPSTLEPSTTTSTSTMKRTTTVTNTSSPTQSFTTTRASVIGGNNSDDEDEMSLGVLILTVAVIVLFLSFIVLVALFIRSRSRSRQRSIDNTAEASVEYNTSNGNVGLHTSPQSAKYSRPNGVGSCKQMEHHNNSSADQQNIYTTVDNGMVSSLHPNGIAANGSANHLLPGQRKRSEAYEMPRMRSRSNSVPTRQAMDSHQKLKKTLSEDLVRDTSQSSLYQPISTENISEYTDYCALDGKPKRVVAPLESTEDSYTMPINAIENQDESASASSLVESQEYDSYTMPYDIVSKKKNLPKNIKAHVNKGADLEDKLAPDDDYETPEDQL